MTHPSLHILELSKIYLIKTNQDKKISMNPSFRIVLNWYLGISVLALTGASSIRPIDFAFGIMVSTILLIVFYLGSLPVGLKKSTEIRKKQIVVQTEIVNWRKFYLFSIVSVGASYYATEYYTGNSLDAILLTLIEAASSYNSYQSHIDELGLTSFGMDQFPAFLSLIFCKFWILYSFVEIIAKGKLINRHAAIVLTLSSFSLIYQSLGRGTSIEIFEVVFLLWFCFSVRTAHIQNKRTKSNNLLIYIFFVVAVLAFNYNISARSEFSEEIRCTTAQMCFDSTSVVSGFSESIGVLSYRLTGYFSFGLFFISRFIDGIIGSTGTLDIFDFLLPLNGFLHDPSKLEVCGKVIDCGVAWMPDFVVYLEYVGWLGLLCLVYAAGRVNYSVMNSISNSSSFAGIGVCYYITVQMVSLPVGNLIFSSYPNKANFLIFLALWMYKLYSRRVFRLLGIAKPKVCV